MVAAPSSRKKWSKQDELSLKQWCHKTYKVNELYAIKQMKGHGFCYCLPLPWKDKRI